MSPPPQSGSGTSIPPETQPDASDILQSGPIEGFEGMSADNTSDWTSFDPPIIFNGATGGYFGFYLTAASNLLDHDFPNKQIAGALFWNGNILITTPFTPIDIGLGTNAWAWSLNLTGLGDDDILELKFQQVGADPLGNVSIVNVYSQLTYAPVPIFFDLPLSAGVPSGPGGAPGGPPGAVGIFAYRTGTLNWHRNLTYGVKAYGPARGMGYNYIGAYPWLLPPGVKVE